MLPKDVSTGDAASYDAGKSVPITLTDSARSVGKQQNLEFGIARTIKNGEYTSFEILTTESMSLKGLSTLSPLNVVIPNLIESNMISTYVVYVKFFEMNNPENEGFYYSKEFDIVPNNTPFANIKTINLLQSNGYRFSTQEGPTIYTPEEVNKESKVSLATSTSLEITIESNVETVLNPTIVFSKLRSDSFVDTFKAAPITIKKGKNYVTIPLPTFDYVPGVYTGVLSFDGGLIKNKIDLQYIIAGDSVSIGSVDVARNETGNFLALQLYANPLDLYREDVVIPASTTVPEKAMYTVNIEFVNVSGKTIYSTTQEVDFSQTEYLLEIPKKYRRIDDVRITITSPATGKVVYESMKNVNFNDKTPTVANLTLYILLYILFTLGAVISLFKQHVKSFLLFAILLVTLFFVRNTFAQMFGMEAYSQGSRPVSLRINNPTYYPRILMRDDVINTVYTCGQPIVLVFKIVYTNCDNTVPSIKVGTSQSSMAGATAALTAIGDYGSKTTGALWTSRGHSAFEYLSGFVAKTLAPVTTPTSRVYMHVKHNPVADDLYMGYNTYAFNVKNSCGDLPPSCSCSGRTEICTRFGVEVSRTANAPACALKASCSATVTGNTATFNTIVTNALGTITYKDADTGQVISNPIQRQVGVGQTIVQKTIATDIDGSTASASCTAENTGTPPCTPGTTGCPGTPPCVPGTPGCPGNPPCTPGTTGCPPVVTQCVAGTPNCPVTTQCPAGTLCPPVLKRDDPTIKLFKAAKNPVKKGEACVYTWDTDNADRCTMVVNNQSVLLQNPTFKGTVSVPTNDGNNQIANIVCAANAIPPNGELSVSAKAVCNVIPEVIER